VTEPVPPTGPRAARLSETLTPEVIAVGLIVVLVAGALATLLTGPDRGADGGTAQATPELPPVSLAPSGQPAPTLVPASEVPVVLPPTPAPTPTPTPSPSPAPTPTPLPTATPAPSPVAWATSAKTVLDAELRLITWREALRAELATKPKRSDGLARILRSSNQAIAVADGALAALGQTDAPDALVVELGAIHDDARAASVKTLDARLADVKAYRTGAGAVVRALDGLEPVMRDLAIAAGRPDLAPELARADASPGAPAVAP
jgi:hypothetical protein